MSKYKEPTEYNKVTMPTVHLEIPKKDAKIRRHKGVLCRWNHQFNY